MSQSDTRHRILDAAERLFAARGFHGTSLREITGAARANLAAVSYHFGSKEALIEAVIDRRLVPLNEDRRARIETAQREARERGETPSAEDILRAFVEPTLRLLDSGPGACDFAFLVGRALAEPDTTVRAAFLGRMAPVFRLLFEALCEALPHLDRDTVFWRLHFSIGALSHALRWTGASCGIAPEVPAPEGVRAFLDTESCVARLTAFVAAGMGAP